MRFCQCYTFFNASFPAWSIAHGIRDRMILDNRVFESFISTDEPFSNALRIFATWILVNNNLCGKLVSSLELLIKFDERFKVTSVPFLFADVS